MRAKIGAVVAALVVALSACARQPVEPNTMRPGGPAYDGHTYGSGNVVSPPVETTTATTQTTAVAADSTERGGHTYGSGN